MDTNRSLFRRIIGSSRTRVLMVFAVLAVAVALLNSYNPLGSDSKAVPAPAVSIEKNAGGLPIGTAWVQQTMIDGVDLQQNWAGTKPDYPYGAPTTIIEGVPTTTALYTVGTNVASYAHVSNSMFVNISGCHSLNDALGHNDHIGCYNAAAAMHNDLSAALKSAPRSLNAYDALVLQNNLDLNFNGYNVADACHYPMGLKDPRGAQPVSFIR